MIYVAFALVAALVVVTLSFAGLLRSLIRQHARERDLLVNQVCHLARVPWQPAPSMPEPDNGEVEDELIDIDQMPV